MHTVIVKYVLPEPKTRAEIMEKFEAAEPRFRAVPTLVRKYFCYDEPSHTGHSVYLFKTKADADAFFGQGFTDSIRQSFDTTPEFFGVDTLMIVDNAAGETLRF